MSKMGYVVGCGLGKYGEGRLEPVEAMAYPPGKSLGKHLYKEFIKFKSNNRTDFNSDF